MSILILDMKFPKTCAACEWSRYSFPNAWCGRTRKTTDVEIAKNGRPDNCPLVPVPPHGDLIERDKLIKGIEADAIWKYNAINEYDSGIRTGARTVMQLVRNAPTIIPAEEGET